MFVQGVRIHGVLYLKDTGDIELYLFHLIRMANYHISDSIHCVK